MSKPLTPTSFARYPLDVIFAKPIAIRILRALILHGGALPATRIAHDARITPNASRTGLQDLIGQSVVKSLGSGRNQLYQTVETHPILPALRALFASEADRFDHMVETIGSLAAAVSEKVLAVWLFGSVAHWSDTAGSDLDVAVVIDDTDAEVSSIADHIRGRLNEPIEKMGYRLSIVSMSLSDVWRMKREGRALWDSIHQKSRRIEGLTTSQVVDLARNRYAEGKSQR